MPFTGRLKHFLNHLPGNRRLLIRHTTTPPVLQSFFVSFSPLIVPEGRPRTRVRAELNEFSSAGRARLPFRKRDEKAIRRVIH